MRRGMDRATGKMIEGIDHLRQSVFDILTTPTGSRWFRRDYGSNLPLLIDAPMNPDLLLDLYAEAATAIDKWEPSLTVKRFEVNAAAEGAMALTVIGDWQIDWPQKTGRVVEVRL